MKRIFFSINIFRNIIVVFVIFICLFPTVRLLLFGSGESQNHLASLTTILPEIFVVLIYLITIYKFSFGQNLQLKKIVSFDWYFLFFIFSNILIGVILSNDLKISVYGFRATYLSMFFYFIGRTFNGYEESESNILLERIFKWFVLFSCIGLFVHFVFSDFEMRMIQLTGHEQTKYFVARMTSLLWTPVLFGTLMAVSSLYFCFKILTTNKKSYYLFLCIVWVCLFLTVSRGPIIGFLIGFIALSVIFKKWKTSMIIFLYMVCSVAILSLILTGSLEMLGWIFTSTADTMAMTDDVSRVKRWLISFEDFKKRPWGYGLGKAGETAFRFFKDTTTPAAVYSTDGWYLKIACETGIYGLLSYLLLSGIYFFKAIKFLKLNSTTFVSFSFALFLMINAQNIVANTLDFHPFIGIYWLIIGISVNRMQAK